VACTGPWGLIPQALLQGTGPSAGAGRAAGVTYPQSGRCPGSCRLALHQPTEAACLRLITRSTLAHFPPPLHFPPSLVKPFPTISINEAKLKHSLFCAACFLLFPTQTKFALPSGQLLAVQWQREEAGPPGTCLLLPEQALSQGKVRPRDQLPASPWVSPTNPVLALS